MRIGKKHNQSDEMDPPLFLKVSLRGPEKMFAQLKMSVNTTNRTDTIEAKVHVGTI